MASPNVTTRSGALTDCISNASIDSNTKKLYVPAGSSPVAVLDIA
jgi:hypothetical protein